MQLIKKKSNEFESHGSHCLYLPEQGAFQKDL